MDTSIDRINLPCRCPLIITTARSDLPGGVHLVREHPTEAIRYAGVHPSSSTERPPLNFGPLSFVLLHGTWLDGEADPPPTTGVRRSKPGNQPAALLVSEELSNEATTQRRPYALSHLEVVRTSQWPLKSSAESIKHFISFLSEQP